MTSVVTELSVSTTGIDGLLRIETKTVSDERGTVREFFRTSAYEGLGVPNRTWNQINVTFTRQGGLRGLHGESADKLIGIAWGTAYGAWLDARESSPTYGQVETMPLSVGLQMYVPAGVCNGFQATSAEGCQYLYCFSAEWTPSMPGVAFNPLDPALGIDWPIPVGPGSPGLISAKDLNAPKFGAS